jgi:hypothetical protein
MRTATELDLQAAIKDVGSLCGFTVKNTTAFRQKGSSGVDRGIADQLWSHRLCPGIYLAIEVKLPGKRFCYSSREQGAAANAGEINVVTSPFEAADRALWFLTIYAVESCPARSRAYAIAKVAGVRQKLEGRR